MNNQAPLSGDELSLCDLYLILKRRRLLILGLAMGLALLALGISSILPKTYQGKVMLSLSAQQLTGQLFTNLPSLSSLAQAFADQLNTRALARELGEADSSQRYQTKFDEKKGLWILSAKGRTPEEAQKATEKLAATARAYLRTQVVSAVTENISAVQAQAVLDQQVAQGNLKRIQERLKGFARAGGGGGTIAAAALESQGVDPMVARSPNPAYTYLLLEKTKLDAQLDQVQARLEALSRLLKDHNGLDRLIGQALQVQIIAPVGEPLRPISPRPVLNTLLAGVLGLMIGVFWAFLAEALAPRESEPRVRAAAE